MCKVLGSSSYVETPEILVCPVCNKEMKYVATINQDVDSRKIISIVDFLLGELNIYTFILSMQRLLPIKTGIQENKYFYLAKEFLLLNKGEYSTIIFIKAK
jgi:uncharacterized protein YbaR (Trm112 family)